MSPEVISHFQLTRHDFVDLEVVPKSLVVDLDRYALSPRREFSKVRSAQDDVKR
jgi:hypothetical protein